ncbi:MAG: hypothetical protein ABSG62_00865 [Terracidiphilus sp.]
MEESIKRRRAERDRSCIGQPHTLFERGIECSDDGLMADIEEDDFRASNSASRAQPATKAQDRLNNEFLPPTSPGETFGMPHSHVFQKRVTLI